MQINDLLNVLEVRTRIRIRIVNMPEDVQYVTGTTGPQGTKKIRAELSEKGALGSYVAGLYPLYHAQELYVECVK